MFHKPIQEHRQDNIKTIIILHIIFYTGNTNESKLPDGYKGKAETLVCNI